MSRQFATNVTTIYDIFCPVPFLPSPFGFPRIMPRNSPSRRLEGARSLEINLRDLLLGPKWLHSGKKKQHKHKLFGPDFPRTFLTLTPECPGVKKFLPTTGAAGKRTFWCRRPRFSARTSMTRRVVEKLCTKKVLRWFFGPYTCRKFCFEQLIFELHRITVHPFLFARINFRL